MGDGFSQIMVSCLYAILFRREKDEKPFTKSILLGIKILSAQTDDRCRQGSVYDNNVS